MLGNQGVTESNMMQYLGIIEQRTIEILHTYAQSQVPHPHHIDIQRQHTYAPAFSPVANQKAQSPSVHISPPCLPSPHLPPSALFLMSQMGSGADGNLGLPGGGAVKQPPPVKPSVQPPASDDFSSGTSLLLIINRMLILSLPIFWPKFLFKHWNADVFI